MAQGVDDNEVVGGDSGDKNPSKSKMSKNAKSEIQTHIKATRKPTFLILDTKEAFNQLSLAFTEALILRQFDLEYHIRIETDVLDYAIGRVLSQLTFNHLTSDQGQ